MILSTSIYSSVHSQQARSNACSRPKRLRKFVLSASHKSLKGIAFLHEKGITHRDIKPASLTVESYDPPLAQVIDFGSATAKTIILYDRPGTITYLAPEQREGEYHGRYVD